jgi:hypothetical protein
VEISLVEDVADWEDKKEKPKHFVRDSWRGREIENGEEAVGIQVVILSQRERESQERPEMLQISRLTNIIAKYVCILPDDYSAQIRKSALTRSSHCRRLRGRSG